MNPAAVSASARRISTLQSDLHRLNLDALVVTYLPNVRYLTGLSATAGIVVVRENGCTLIVDFRYETAAKALLESLCDHPYDLYLVEHTYDQSVAALITALPPASRIGVEAASMTVGRFYRLAEALQRSDEGSGATTASTLVT